MKKVFKKSLACVLALMLCLTAMVGAMSVSAAVSDVSVLYATYFSNDTRAYQVCPGTNVRAQVTVSGITAGAAYGIKVDIPANVEITEFSKFGTAAFDESSITTYYNEELGLYTILATATVGGAQTFCIKYNVTDATTKKVHILNCEVEAAESSSSELYTAKAFETGNGNAYYEVKAHEAAEAVTENVVAATCTAAGSHDEVVYCKWGLHEEISRETVVDPAKGHTAGEAVEEDRVEPTCGTAGSYDSVVYCTVCGEEISRENIAIPATGVHTDGTPVVENNVPATCEAEGGYDTVVYCSVCNAELSRVHTTLDPLGHNYAYTNNGDGTHTGTCQNDAEHTVTDAHNFVDGVCDVCGAVESTGTPVDSDLTFYNLSLSYGATSLEFKFYINNTVLDLYDNVSFVLIPNKYDSNGYIRTDVEPIEVSESQLVAAGKTRHTYTYKDAYLYELGLNFTYMLKAYDSEGNLVAVSKKNVTSAAEQLKLFHAKYSSLPKLQTLITDTLIVGDEAVNSMKNGKDKNSDICTATSILKGYNTSDRTPSYDSYNTINSFKSFYEGVSTEKTATHRVIQSVQIEKLPFITYRIKDTNSVFDIDKFEFNVSYTKLEGDGSSAEFNETYTTANSKLISLSSGYVTFKFDEIGAQNCDKDLTVTVKYDGKNFFTSNYSIETFLGSQLSNANTGVLCDALIKLGIAFKNNATK